MAICTFIAMRFAAIIRACATASVHKAGESDAEFGMPCRFFNYMRTRVRVVALTQVSRVMRQ